jgi:hypothetical protein
MFQSHLPICFWFFFRRTCCPLLNNHFPHFHIYNVNPDLATLRMFGTHCFVSTLEAHRTKFQSRVKKCIYVGHSSGAKGFLIFNLHTRELFVSTLGMSFFMKQFVLIIGTCLLLQLIPFFQ